jgi:hypothetical protein
MKREGGLISLHHMAVTDLRVLVLPPSAVQISKPVLDIHKRTSCLCITSKGIKHESTNDRSFDCLGSTLRIGNTTHLFFSNDNREPTTNRLNDSNDLKPHSYLYKIQMRCQEQTKRTNKVLDS